jgi:curved DNA-binding protein CbpA
MHVPRRFFAANS